MGTIYNSDLQKEAKEAFRIQQNIDVIPSKFDEKIIPVCEVNPKLLRRIKVVKNTATSNATTSTIYTTPVNQDFFISGLMLGVIKDGTSTSIVSTITTTIDGATTILAAIPSITLTAQSEMISISFPFPIKIDRNVTITCTNSTNVANVVSRAVIYGYVDEISAA